MLFLGEYYVAFSGKGRVVIPKKIRDALQNGKTFILTKGYDRCLSGYRNEDWEKGANELIGPSFLEAKKIDTKRHIFSSATTVEIDDQGRVVIPRNLLEYAGLSEVEAVLIGVGSYFEIWDPEKWKEYSKKVEINIKQLSSEAV